ncbi:hypothetical protein [Kitasatospora sp. LaBMicrA B282]|uniref:hypothetical protein n=1 Tax=Kitasatospora sp. LaBMicrA B282 TaxID=3420949 RepID=UPI003D0C1EA3
MSTATLWKNPEDLLVPEDCERVVATVLDNNKFSGMDDETARRIVREALKFVAACGEHRDRSLAPSRVVDEGWHALILNTRVHAELCGRFGGLVHHYPQRPDPRRCSGAVVQRTLDAIEASGYRPDRKLWGDPQTGKVVVAANCQHTPPDCQVTCMNAPSE